MQVVDEKQLAEAAGAGASQEEQEQDNKALEVCVAYYQASHASMCPAWLSAVGATSALCGDMLPARKQGADQRRQRRLQCRPAGIWACHTVTPQPFHVTCLLQVIMSIVSEREEVARRALPPPPALPDGASAAAAEFLQQLERPGGRDRDDRDR
jgi:hypothetical protein